jgi:propionyl-CoA synthetase
VIDDSRAPLYRWFAGGRMNTCYNALDRHVERGRADQPALIYDSPVTDTVATFTYRELRDAVARFAGALAAQGVARGDRVIVYMPMVPEAVIAMLACARLGAIHSVVFGGFAANELATRIEDAKPKVIVSASCGIEPARLVEYKPLLDAAIDMAESKPQRCIVLQRPMLEAALDPDRDVEWNARWPEPRRRLASRWMQPIRSTSSIRPGRLDSRKGSSATTAATRWRSPGL